VVAHRSDHRWSDGDWLALRARTDVRRAPLSIYEVHPGSWLPHRPGHRPDYRELAAELADYATRLGFSHVQLMPVTEHPFGGSWGYQVTSYYAPTARFGDPDGLRHLVDHLHRAGVGVLLDFVPAHFPRDDWALGRFDGTPLYEHPDPRRGEHPDWGTLVFDFGRPEVRNFLIASALYWLEEFHVDGLRVDAVSSMLYLDYSRAEGQWSPNVHGGRENLEAVGLLRELTGTVHSLHPGTLLIAEESTAWPGVTDPAGLGFDLKWNLGWMHDTLLCLGHDPVLRAGLHDRLTLPISYAWDEHFVLPLSHDEVVHGKGSLWQRMPGDERMKAAGVRALLAHMWAHPGKKLLFMGGEFGQPSEWDPDGGLPWPLVGTPGAGPYHLGIQRLVTRLNRLYRELPALHRLDSVPEGFDWISADDAAGNVLAFLRQADDGSLLACVANFAGVAHRRYRIGLPREGTWSVVLDTDDPDWGGSGSGGSGSVRRRTVRAVPLPWHGRPAAVELDLPASSVVWLLHR
jgi:1,4-alpha-glucan branching enzyme